MCCSLHTQEVLNGCEVWMVPKDKGPTQRGYMRRKEQTHQGWCSEAGGDDWLMVLVRSQCSLKRKIIANPAREIKGLTCGRMTPCSVTCQRQEQPPCTPPPSHPAVHVWYTNSGVGTGVFNQRPYLFQSAGEKKNQTRIKLGRTQVAVKSNKPPTVEWQRNKQKQEKAKCSRSSFNASFIYKFSLFFLFIYFSAVNHQHKE